MPVGLEFEQKQTGAPIFRDAESVTWGEKTKNAEARGLSPARRAACATGCSSAASRRDGLQHFFRLIQVLLNHGNRVCCKRLDHCIIAAICLALKVSQILLVI